MLVITLAAGCGEEITMTGRTPAEAVAQQAKDSTGVKVTKLVRVDYSGVVTPTPSSEDDTIVPLNIGEYSESRTTGILRLGAAASDLTTTFHRTNIPEDWKDFIPDDLSYMTTRAISISGTDTYEQRADRRYVPAGKAWLHHSSPKCGMAARLLGGLDARAVLSPEVLQRLAAPAPSSGGVIDAVATVVHSGRAAQAEFSIPDQGDDPVMAVQLPMQSRSLEVSWQLWVGPDRLPRRVRLITTDLLAEESGPRSAVTEIDFTDWGSDVSIGPPPKDQVHETGTCLDPEP
ncbi:hypothetical protein [Streptosporangium sp. 'caverna']|uniref:hypothetical protein n=1 Tax=Streptosporangium sp. 'caverna' TaxID=2202249 RepID=UPI0013A6F2B1|nr:hypothetical protein [Streptosporangium sp. 'caverna']